MNLKKMTLHTVSGALLVGGFTPLAALAAQQEKASGAIEEITVTARYRVESSQDTPLSITAVKGEDLIVNGGVDITAISKSAPNMLLESGGTFLGKSASVSIRGIGEGDYNFAVEGAVGFYVDDVYHSTVFGSLFDLLDVERVEVLRGPQGTLFGKNSIGGAVRVISNEPKGDGSGSLRFTGGSYNRFEVRGHADMALVEDKVALRIAGNMRQRDGYMDVLDFGCANPTLTGTGVGPLANVLRAHTTAGDCKVGTEGGEEVYSARATLKAELSDDITLTIAAETSKDGGESGAYKVIEQPDYTSPDPSLPGFLPADNLNELRVIPAYGVPYDERFLTNSMYTSYATFKADFTGFDVPNVSEVKSWSARAVVDWTLSDTLSFKSITAYRTYDGNFSRDGDQSPLDMGNSRTVLEHEQISQEVRLSGLSMGEDLEWTVGAFYFDSEGKDQSDIHIWNLWFWEPTVLRTDDPVTSDTKAIFGQGVLSLTDKLDLSAGLRYSDESKSYSYLRTFAGDYRGGEVFFPRTVKTTNYSRTDWKLGLDYTMSDDVMVYGVVSTGYRGGGFNPRPLFTNQATKVDPEELVSYEVGVKSDLLDQALRLNLSAFYSDYTNLQQTASGPDPENPGATVIARTNIGKAAIKGLELEVTYRPITNLTLSGTFGLTDYEYKELGSAAEVSGGPCLDCKPVRVPDYTYNLNAEYVSSLGDFGSLIFGTSYSYRDRVFYDLPNTIEYSQEGVGVLNARVGWTSADESWDVMFNVTNVTEEEYYTAIGTGSSAGTAGSPSRPREWSLSIGRQF